MVPSFQTKFKNHYSRCPNFELYIREWLESDEEYRWGWGIINILGHPDRGPGLFNRNAFTKNRLEELLSDQGFITISCSITSTWPESRNPIDSRSDGDILFYGYKPS